MIEHEKITQNEKEFKEKPWICPEMEILTFCHEMRLALFARHDLQDSASQNRYKVLQYISILASNWGELSIFLLKHYEELKMY